MVEAPAELSAVAFPRLSDRDLAEIGECPELQVRRFRDGERIYESGDADIPFFIVVAGAIEIIDETGDAPRVIVTHRRGQFTGEVGWLTGARALATAVARGDTEAWAFTQENVRELLIVSPHIGDTILSALIARRQMLRDSREFTGLRLIGSRYSRDTFRIRDFLSRNRLLFTYLDVEEHPEVAKILEHWDLKPEDTPVVAFGCKLVLRNPSNEEIARQIGIKRPLDQTVYDLAVVGGGPSGLAAAVYAASEALKTVVLERAATGGQAGTSMRIENYLGFPTGLTGSELADRAVVQANKFGAVLSVPTAVERLRFDNAYCVLELAGGESITAKSLLIASGAQYRKLAVEGCEAFEGRGVYYAATPAEAADCRGADVVVVGGGNSAGQAAVFLSDYARKVLLVCRGDSLAKAMSAYLVHRIETTPNIEVFTRTEVAAMRGDGHLAEVDLRTKGVDGFRRVETSMLFSFIGATPHTGWLPPEIERDEREFVRTGQALASSPQWKLQRQPFLLETSRPGVFAAGDVRSGSVKRVASAVGEGAMAVQFVHEYLKEM
jgi:thioredoxin reductase (NADPH)